jgi:hypothetical protein
VRYRSPLYKLRASSGKEVVVDVTSSISPGLPPHGCLQEKVIPWLKARNARTVVDFGAGALRHTFPLLKAGFEVCVVEFEEAFSRPVCAEMRAKASRKGNFSALVWPRDFRKTKRRFDAALLCYVLQVMPIADERKDVIKEVAKHLSDDGYLLYMSRVAQLTPHDARHKVEDGVYRWPERDTHSFYREFTPEETQRLFEPYGFTRIRSLSTRGTEQIYFYTVGKGSWI